MATENGPRGKRDKRGRGKGWKTLQALSKAAKAGKILGLVQNDGLASRPNGGGPLGRPGRCGGEACGGGGGGKVMGRRSGAGAPTGEKDLESYECNEGGKRLFVNGS